MSDLHTLCQNGNLKKVKGFVQELDDQSLAEMLVVKKGIFGYTPLHDVAANGKADILDFLLERTKDVHVNCRANGGYTLAHVAASSGKKDCIKVLLDHSADTSIVDEFGKTPMQIAKLSNKTSIVRLLMCEGK